MEEQEERLKKLKAGKERLAAFQKKKTKKKKKHDTSTEELDSSTQQCPSQLPSPECCSPTDAGAACPPVQSSEDADPPPNDHQTTNEMMADQSSVHHLNDTEDLTDGVNQSLSENEKHALFNAARVELHQATSKISELEESVLGKQRALERLGAEIRSIKSENERLKQANVISNSQVNSFDHHENSTPGNQRDQIIRIQELENGIIKRDELLRQLSSRLQISAQDAGEKGLQQVCSVETQKLAQQVQLLQLQLQQAGEKLNGQMKQHCVSAQALQDAKNEILNLQLVIHQKDEMMSQLVQKLSQVNGDYAHLQSSTAITEQQLLDHQELVKQLSTLQERSDCLLTHLDEERRKNQKLEEQLKDEKLAHIDIRNKPVADEDNLQADHFSVTLTQPDKDSTLIQELNSEKSKNEAMTHHLQNQFHLIQKFVSLYHSEDSSASTKEEINSIVHQLTELRQTLSKNYPLTSSHNLPSLLKTSLLQDFECQVDICPNDSIPNGSNDDNAHIFSLNKELEELRKKLQDLHLENQDLSRDMDKSKSSFDALLATKDDLEKQYKTVEESRNSLSVTIQGYDNDLQALKEQNVNLERLLSARSEEADRAVKAETVINNELDLLKSEKETLNLNLQEKDTNVQNLLEKLELSHQEVMNLKNMKRTLEQELAGSLEKNGQLQEQLDTQITEMNELRVAEKDWAEKLDVSQAEVNRLKTEIESVIDESSKHKKTVENEMLKLKEVIADYRQQIVQLEEENSEQVQKALDQESRLLELDQQIMSLNNGERTAEINNEKLLKENHTYAEKTLSLVQYFSSLQSLLLSISNTGQQENFACCLTADDEPEKFGEIVTEVSALFGRHKNQIEQLESEKSSLMTTFMQEKEDIEKRITEKTNEIIIYQQTAEQGKQHIEELQSENQKLMFQLQESETNLRKSGCELERLQAQVDMLHVNEAEREHFKELDQLVIVRGEEIERLKTEMDSLSKNLEKENENQQQVISELNKEVARKEETEKQTSEILTERQNQIDSLQRLLQEEAEDVNRLKEELVKESSSLELNEKADEIQKLQKHITTLKSQLDDHLLEIETLNTQKNVLVSEVDHLKSKYSSLEGNFQKEKSNLDQMGSEKIRFENENISLREELTESRNLISKMESQVESENRRLTQEYEALSTKLKEMTHEKESLESNLQSENERLLQEYEALSTKLKETTTEKESLESNLQSENERLLQEYEALSIKLKEMTHEKESLESNLQSENERLIQKYEAISTKLKETTTEKESLESNLQSENERLTQEYEALSTKLKEMTHEKESLESNLQSENERLLQEYEALSTKLKEITTEKESLESNLQSENERLLQEYEALSTKLKEITTEKESLESNLQSENERLIQEYEALSTKLKEMTHGKESLESNLQSENERLIQEYEALSTKLKEITTEKVSLESNLQSENERLLQEYEALSTKLKEMTHGKESLESNLQSENERLIQEYKALSTKLKEMTHEKECLESNLQSENERLIQEYESISTKLKEMTHEKESLESNLQSEKERHTQEYEALSTKLDEMDKEKESLENRYAHLGGERDQEVSKMDAELSALKVLLKTQTEETLEKVKEFEEKLQESEKQVLEWERKAQQLKSEQFSMKAGFKKQIDKLNKEKEQHKTKLSALSKEKEREGNRLSELLESRSAELEQANAELIKIKDLWQINKAELDIKVEDLSRNEDAQQEEMKKLKASIVKFSEEKSKLSNSLKELEKKSHSKEKSLSEKNSKLQSTIKELKQKAKDKTLLEENAKLQDSLKKLLQKLSDTEAALLEEKEQFQESLKELEQTSLEKEVALSEENAKLKDSIKLLESVTVHSAKQEDSLNVAKSDIICKETAQIVTCAGDCNQSEPDEKPSYTKEELSKKLEEIEYNLSKKQEYELEALTEKYERELKYARLEILQEIAEEKENYERDLDQKYTLKVESLKAETDRSFIKGLQKVRSEMESKHREELHELKVSLMKECLQMAPHELESRIGNLVQDMHVKNKAGGLLEKFQAKKLAESRDSLLQQIDLLNNQYEQIQDEQFTFPEKIIKKHPASSPRIKRKFDTLPQDIESASRSLVELSRSKGCYDEEKNCYRLDCQGYRKRYEIALKILTEKGLTSFDNMSEKSSFEVDSLDGSTSIGDQQRDELSQDLQDEYNEIMERTMTEPTITSCFSAKHSPEPQCPSCIILIEEKLSLKKRLSIQLELFGKERFLLQNRCEHLSVELENALLIRDQQQKELSIVKEMQQKRNLNPSEIEFTQLKVKLASTEDQVTFLRNKVSQNEVERQELKTKINDLFVKLIDQQHYIDTLEEDFSRSRSAWQHKGTMTCEDHTSVLPERELGPGLNRRHSDPSINGRYMMKHIGDFFHPRNGRISKSVGNLYPVDDISFEPAMWIPKIPRSQRDTSPDSLNKSPFSDRSSQPEENEYYRNYSQERTDSSLSETSTLLPGDLFVSPTTSSPQRLPRATHSSPSLTTLGGLHESERIVPGFSALEKENNSPFSGKHMELFDEVADLKRLLSKTKEQHIQETAVLKETIDRLERFGSAESQSNNSQSKMTHASKDPDCTVSLSSDVVDLRQKVSLLRETCRKLTEDNSEMMKKLYDQECLVMKTKYFGAKNNAILDSDELDTLFGKQLLLLQKHRDELSAKLSEERALENHITELVARKSALEQKLCQENELKEEIVYKKGLVDSELASLKAEYEHVLQEQLRLEEVIRDKDMTEKKLREDKFRIDQQLSSISSKLDESEKIIQNMQEKKSSSSGDDDRHPETNLEELRSQFSHELYDAKNTIEKQNIQRLECLRKEMEEQHTRAVELLCQQLRSDFKLRESRLEEHHASHIASLHKIHGEQLESLKDEYEAQMEELKQELQKDRFKYVDSCSDSTGSTEFNGLSQTEQQKQETHLLVLDKLRDVLSAPQWQQLQTLMQEIKRQHQIELDRVKSHCEDEIDLRVKAARLTVEQVYKSQSELMKASLEEKKQGELAEIRDTLARYHNEEISRREMEWGGHLEKLQSQYNHQIEIGQEPAPKGAVGTLEGASLIQDLTNRLNEEHKKLSEAFVRMGKPSLGLKWLAVSSVTEPWMSSFFDIIVTDQDVHHLREVISKEETQRDQLSNYPGSIQPNLHTADSLECLDSASTTSQDGQSNRYAVSMSDDVIYRCLEEQKEEIMLLRSKILKEYEQLLKARTDSMVIESRGDIGQLQDEIEALQRQYEIQIAGMASDVTADTQDTKNLSWCLDTDQRQTLNNLLEYFKSKVNSIEQRFNNQITGLKFQIESDLSASFGEASCEMDGSFQTDAGVPLTSTGRHSSSNDMDMISPKINKETVSGRNSLRRSPSPEEDSLEEGNISVDETKDISAYQDEIRSLRRQLEEVITSKTLLQRENEELVLAHKQAMSNLQEDLEHKHQMDIHDLQTEFDIQLQVELKKQAVELLEKYQGENQESPVQNRRDSFERELVKRTMTAGHFDSYDASDSRNVADGSHRLDIPGEKNALSKVIDYERRTAEMRRNFEQKMQSLRSELSEKREIEKRELTSKHQTELKNLQKQLTDLEEKYDSVMEGLRTGDAPEVAQMMRDKYDTELELAKALMQQEFDESLEGEQARLQEKDNKMAEEKEYFRQEIEKLRSNYENRIAHLEYCLNTGDSLGTSQTMADNSELERVKAVMQQKFDETLKEEQSRMQEQQDKLEEFLSKQTSEMRDLQKKYDQNLRSLQEMVEKCTLDTTDGSGRDTQIINHLKQLIEEKDNKMSEELTSHQQEMEKLREQYEERIANLKYSELRSSLPGDFETIKCELDAAHQAELNLVKDHLSTKYVDMINDLEKQHQIQIKELQSENKVYLDRLEKESAEKKDAYVQVDILSPADQSSSLLASSWSSPLSSAEHDRTTTPVELMTTRSFADVARASEKGPSLPTASITSTNPGTNRKKSRRRGKKSAQVDTLSPADQSSPMVSPWSSPLSSVDLDRNMAPVELMTTQSFDDVASASQKLSNPTTGGVTLDNSVANRKKSGKKSKKLAQSDGKSSSFDSVSFPCDSQVSDTSTIPSEQDVKAQGNLFSHLVQSYLNMEHLINKKLYAISGKKMAAGEEVVADSSVFKTPLHIDHFKRKRFKSADRSSSNEVSRRANRARSMDPVDSRYARSQSTSKKSKKKKFQPDLSLFETGSSGEDFPEISNSSSATDEGLVLSQQFSDNVIFSGPTLDSESVELITDTNNRLQASIMRLLEMMEETTQQLLESKTVQQELLDSLRSKDGDVQNLNQRLQEMADQLKQEINSKEQLALELYKSQGLVEGFNKERDHLSTRMKDLEDREAVLAMENETLRNKIHDLQMTESEVTSLHQEVQRQQTILYDNVGREHQDVSVITDPVELSEEQGLLDEISQLNEEKRHMTHLLQQNQDNYEARIRDLIASEEDLEHKYSEMLDEKRQQVDDLRLQLESVENKLKANKQFLDEQAQEREQEREESLREINKWKSAIKQFENKEKSETRLKKEVEELSDQIENRITIQSEMLLKNEKLERDLHDKELTAQELKNLVNQLEQELDQKNNIEKRLQEKISQFEVKLKSLQEMNDELSDELKSSLPMSEKKINQLENQLEDQELVYRKKAMSIDEELKKAHKIEEELSNEKTALEQQVCDQLLQIASFRNQLDDYRQRSLTREAAESTDGSRPLLDQLHTQLQHKDAEIRQLTDMVDKLELELVRKDNQLGRLEMVNFSGQPLSSQSSVDEQENSKLLLIKDENQKLKKQVSTLQRQVTTAGFSSLAQQLLDDKDLQNDELRAQLAQQQSHYDQSETNCLKEELEKKTLEIEEKDAEICSLKHVINSLQHGSPNVSGEHFPGDVSLPLNQEALFLEDSMPERTSLQQELSAVLTDRDNQIDSLKSQLEEKEDIVQKIQMVSVLEQQQTIVSLQDTLQDKDFTLDQMYVEVDGLHAEVANLTEHQTKLQEDFDTVQAMLESKEKEIESLTKELTDLRVQMEKNHTDVAVSENLDDVVSDLVMRYEVDLKKLQKNVRELENVIEEKSEENYTLNEKVEELDNLKPQIEKLKTDLQEKERKLSSNVSAMQTLEKHVDSSNKVIRELQKREDHWHLKYSQTELQLREREEHLHQLQNELLERDENEGTVRQRLIVAEQQLGVQQQNIETLQSQIAERDKRFKECNETSSELKDTISSLEEEKEQMAMRMSTKDQEIPKLQEQVARLQKVVHDQAAEISRREKSYMTLVKMHQEKDELISMEEGRTIVLRSEVEELQNELLKKDEELNEVLGELENLKMSSKEKSSEETQEKEETNDTGQDDGVGQDDGESNALPKVIVQQKEHINELQLELEKLKEVDQQKSERICELEAELEERLFEIKSLETSLSEQRHRFELVSCKAEKLQEELQDTWKAKLAGETQIDELRQRLFKAESEELKASSLDDSQAIQSKFTDLWCEIQKRETDVERLECELTDVHQQLRSQEAEISHTYLQTAQDGGQLSEEITTLLGKVRRLELELDAKNKMISGYEMQLKTKENAMTIYHDNEQKYRTLLEEEQQEVLNSEGRIIVLRAEVDDLLNELGNRDSELSNVKDQLMKTQGQLLDRAQEMARLCLGRSGSDDQDECGSVNVNSSVETAREQEIAASIVAKNTVKMLKEELEMMRAKFQAHTKQLEEVHLCQNQNQDVTSVDNLVVANYQLSEQVNQVQDELRVTQGALKRLCMAISAQLDNLQHGQQQKETLDAETENLHKDDRGTQSDVQDAQDTHPPEQNTQDRLQVLLNRMHQEGLQSLSLAELQFIREYASPKSNSKDIDFQALRAAWEKERQSLLSAIQALKDLLANEQQVAGAQWQQQSGMFSVDWRSKILQALSHVFAKERSVLQSELHSYVFSRGDGAMELTDIQRLENKIKDQDVQQKAAMEQVVNADRQSLLSELQDCSAKIAIMELQHHEEKQELSEKLTNLQVLMSKREEKSQRHIQLLEYRLQQSRIVHDDLQTSLETERKRSAELAAELTKAKSHSLDMHNECTNMQVNLVKTKDALEQEHSRYLSLMAVREEEKVKTAELMEQLDLEKNKLHELKMENEILSGKMGQQRDLEFQHLHLAMENEREKLKNAEDIAEEKQQENLTLKQELEMERVQNQSLIAQHEADLAALKCRLQENETHLEATNRNLNRVKALNAQLTQSLENIRSVEQSTSECDHARIMDLQALLNTEQSQLRDLQQEVETARSESQAKVLALTSELQATKEKLKKEKTKFQKLQVKSDFVESQYKDNERQLNYEKERAIRLQAEKHTLTLELQNVRQQKKDVYIAMENEKKANKKNMKEMVRLVDNNKVEMHKNELEVQRLQEKVQSLETDLKNTQLQERQLVYEMEYNTLRSSQHMESRTTHAHVQHQDDSDSSKKEKMLSAYKCELENLRQHLEMNGIKIQDLLNKSITFVKANRNAQSSEAFATLRPLVITVGELLSDLRQLQTSLTLEKESPGYPQLSATVNQRTLQHNRKLISDIFTLNEETLALREQLLEMRERICDYKNRDAVQQTRAVDEEGMSLLETSLAVERMKWEQERTSYELALENAEKKIEKLQRNLRIERSEGLAAVATNPCVADKELIQSLYQKYIRAETFRKALIYQKNYLLVLLGGFQDSERTVLAVLTQMGATDNSTLQEMEPRQPGRLGCRRPLTMFRSVARAAIAICRMKFLVRNFQQLRAIPLPASFVPRPPALNQQPSGYTASESSSSSSTTRSPPHFHLSPTERLLPNSGLPPPVRNPLPTNQPTTRSPHTFNATQLENGGSFATPNTNSAEVHPKRLRFMTPPTKEFSHSQSSMQRLPSVQLSYDHPNINQGQRAANDSSACSSESALIANVCPSNGDIPNPDNLDEPNPEDSTSVDNLLHSIEITHNRVAQLLQRVEAPENERRRPRRKYAGFHKNLDL